MAAYQQASPLLGALGVGGTFLGTQTPINRINEIQGIQVGAQPRYINPYGGQEAAQFGLQNFQNQLAGGGGGGSNPWMGALSGAATGAGYGTMTGNPYIAAGGAVIGAGAGALGYPQFSDSRMKENIVRVGASPSGVPIFEFTFKDDKDKRRFRGTVAQELMKTRWDAVYQHKGKLMVDYDKLDIRMEEVK
jgi:Chaperone of endosialidase